MINIKNIRNQIDSILLRIRSELVSHTDLDNKKSWRTFQQMNEIIKKEQIELNNLFEVLELQLEEQQKEIQDLKKYKKILELEEELKQIKQERLTEVNIKERINDVSSTQQTIRIIY